MILTKCAACAAPLAHDAPRCVRCKIRYCNLTCQHDHWRRGHKQICKKIHRGGNAEQYHADNKYKEAVAVAVEKCANDTKGQTCYICTEALHWKTTEGLVRGCACRGTAGFVHVSCLAEEAKIFVAEGKENNLDIKVKNQSWAKWHTCGLCEQDYHGVVNCALGWACWKTYVGRPEADLERRFAMTELGLGLKNTGRFEEALPVQEAELALRRRLGGDEHNRLISQGNLAGTYRTLGRLEEALQLQRDVYSENLKINGEDKNKTLIAACNYASCLLDLQRFEEARSFLRKTVPVARRSLGESYVLTLIMRTVYAKALYKDAGATLGDLREAVKTIEEAERSARRVLGSSHPLVKFFESYMRDPQAALCARETPRGTGA